LTGLAPVTVGVVHEVLAHAPCPLWVSEPIVGLSAGGTLVSHLVQGCYLIVAHRALLRA